MFALCKCKKTLCYMLRSDACTGFDIAGSADGGGFCTTRTCSWKTNNEELPNRFHIPIEECRNLCYNTSLCQMITYTYGICILYKSRRCRPAIQGGNVPIEYTSSLHFCYKGK